MQGYPQAIVATNNEDNGTIGNCPRMLHLLGRSTARENGDICGEYIHVGMHLCHAVYTKVGTNITIRYWPKVRRWIIDREGVRETDICVAYADDNVGSMHPGHAALVWHVWENAAHVHVQDAGIIALDAPKTVAFVGRDADRENCNANGEYEISGVRHGKPVYQHPVSGAIIRYFAPEDRWLLSAALDGPVCSGFAERNGTPHPGFPSLEWHMYETQVKNFVFDPAAKTLVAPGFLHVIGRSFQAGNARINGTYHLMGVSGGHPVYVQPNTHAFIRHSSSGDRWLIVCDGYEEPTLLSKMYQWILKADTSTLYDNCSAFAEAHGTAHPGHSKLEWNVWEPQSQSHRIDQYVRVTTAPLALNVSGRDTTRENSDIMGDYMLVTTHSGRPVYQKPGTSSVIRYWPPMNRWLIDRSGFRNLDSCVAYADCHPNPENFAGSDEHPAGKGFVWHVFETNRGTHFPDPSVRIDIPVGAPVEMPTTNQDSARSANKRGPSQSDPYMSDKRRRLDIPPTTIADPPVAIVPPTVTTAAKTGGTRRRWFGLFGG